MESMIWIWLSVMVMTLVCEGLTTALVSIWFAPGALIALALAVLKAPIWVQSVAFFIASAICVVLFQSLFKKRLGKSKKMATNIDMLIGQKAVVSEKIDNIRAEGCVKVNGQLWSARSEDESIIPNDEIVEIIAVSGVKLVCRKI